MYVNNSFIEIQTNNKYNKKEKKKSLPTHARVRLYLLQL